MPKRRRTPSELVGDHFIGEVVDQWEGGAWVAITGAEVVPEPYREVRFLFEQRGDAMVCMGFHLVLADGELTARALHEVPFGALRDVAAAWAPMFTGVPTPRGERRRGREGHDADFYRHVADLYRYACAHHPRAPVQWIANEGHPHAPVSEHTVRRWLRTARKEPYQFLGEATPGKAGEQGGEG